MTGEVMVSVFCVAFNHEDYLRETLEGFVMQQTDFRFEVFVHDDASSDETAKIMREYEEKYPDIFRCIYQKENQYSKGVRIIWDILYPLSTGKYLAWCEGDDKWIDPHKLQKQIKYMEEHPSCSLCTHRAISCDQESGECYVYPKQLGTRNYRIEDIIARGGRIFALNSSVFRREVFDSFPDALACYAMGDYQTFIHAADYGEVVCLQDIMSIYRFKARSSTSIKRFTDTASAHYSQSYRTNFNKMALDIMYKLDSYYQFKYHRYLEKSITYYTYHICKHSGQLEEIKAEKYDNQRLIDLMRSETRSHVNRIKKKSPGQIVPAREWKLKEKNWAGDQPVEVSVFCVTQNDEDYIQDSLNSVLAQETTFRYEILVFDNGSSDTTTEILKKYADQYPDIIIPVFAEESLAPYNYSFVRKFLYPLAKGKYYAWCNGCDYWNDSAKLQKQYDHLEEDGSCMIATHDVVLCDNEKLKCARSTVVAEEDIDEVQWDVLIEAQKCFLSTFFVRKSLYESIPKGLEANLKEHNQLLLLGADMGGWYASREIMAVCNVMIEGSYSLAEHADEELKHKRFKAYLDDIEKFIQLFNKEKYLPILNQLWTCYTYHVCKYMGEADLISGQKFDEYKLVDRMEEETVRCIERLSKKYCLE